MHLDAPVLRQEPYAPKCISHESGYALTMDLMHLGAPILGQRPYAPNCIKVRHFFLSV